MPAEERAHPSSEERRKKENGVGDTVNHDRSLKRETAVGWKEEDLFFRRERENAEVYIEFATPVGNA